MLICRYPGLRNFLVCRLERRGMRACRDKSKVDRWGCAAGSISWFLSRRSQFAVTAASTALRCFFRCPPAVFVGEVDAPS